MNYRCYNVMLRFGPTLVPLEKS